MKNKKPKVRLSTKIYPIEYDIKLRPDLENFTFSGIETITINVSSPTKVVTLHSKEIQIDTVEFELKKIKIFGKVTHNEANETATFTFPENLPKGKNKLTIAFTGILNDKMRGFYRSSYVYEGKVNHLATTQFEATDARRAFPCFDEPAHKAVFHVSLVVPKGQTAISNTLPVSKIEHEAGFEVVRFAPTPKMSTYLLAFIVGKFEYIEKKSKNGVLVRVYTTPGKKSQAGFALEVTSKVLDFYEEYFDIPYPLDTLDMIAIPDFTSLAMENWGAITFREMGLLVDENNTSLSTKELIVEVIAHELAHQWFGNLVTMEWWTHLWLNEGFASYIPYIVIDKLFPEWKIWERFVTGKHGTGMAMRLDALKNTHPIEVPVHHPSEIGEIFDEISYSKGACVIHMLASYIGPDAFRDGLRHYLKKHSYKNTETIHLWESFEKVSKKPVKKMMDVWTSQSGYPIVQIAKKNNKITLTQERYFTSPISRKQAHNKTTWPVPVTLQTENGTENIFLDKKQITLQNDSSWFKVNKNETSFFRTEYSHELLLNLKEAVLRKEISNVDRLGIIRDLFALNASGRIPVDYVLDFLLSYKDEEDYIVWSEISAGLGALRQIFAKSKSNNKLNKFVIDLYSPIYKKLGFESKTSDAHTDTLLRPLVITVLGQAGLPEVVKNIKKLFSDIRTKKKVDANMRGLVYSITAQYGGEKEYKEFIKLYKTETLHEEKNRIGYALGDFENDKLLCETAHFALSENVRPQDTIGILSYLALNPLGRDIWIKSMKTNWQTMLNRYGDGGHSLGRLLEILKNSPEKKHLDFYKTFFKTRPAPGATRSIEQAKERIEANVLWLKRDAKALDKFLKRSNL
ncbi:MAG TPA: M1 family metallopeptidase [Candidatus Paceibacterota bacterium]